MWGDIKQNLNEKVTMLSRLPSRLTHSTPHPPVPGRRWLVSLNYQA